MPIAQTIPASHTLLALLLGLADKVEGWDAGGNTGESSRVQCVVDFFGPTDLMLYCETPALEKIFFVPLIGCPAGSDPDRYKKASPIEHVTKDDPPFLIVHGTADLVVPIIHSERLHEKLVATGVKSELVTVKGAPEVVLPRCETWRHDDEVIPLETLRLGLRGDTLKEVLLGGEPAAAG